MGAGRRFSNILECGPANQGQQIAFTLQFLEGAETLFCDHALLSLLLGTLTTCGEQAEQVRGGVRAKELLAVAPFRATKVANSGHSEDGQVVMVEFATDRGFPIQIAMSPAHATETIEFLQREILNAAKPPKEGPRAH
jgi:hypothetical protein